MKNRDKVVELIINSKKEGNSDNIVSPNDNMNRCLEYLISQVADDADSPLVKLQDVYDTSPITAVMIQRVLVDRVNVLVSSNEYAEEDDIVLDELISSRKASKKFNISARNAQFYITPMNLSEIGLNECAQTDNETIVNCSFEGRKISVDLSLTFGVFKAA